MEFANVILNIGGDAGNTVPKIHVTPAEIAVLRSIHGSDAVRDIHPIGVRERSHRAERERLRGLYGGALAGDGKPIVEALFPGAAARVFESLDELELPSVLFKPGFESRGHAGEEIEDILDMPSGESETGLFA